MDYSTETLDRIKKLERIRSLWVNPFATKFDTTHNIWALLPQTNSIAWAEPEKWPLKEILSQQGLRSIEHIIDTPTDRISLAWRVMLHRSFGKICFATISDGTGKIQILFSRENCSINVDGEIRSELWETPPEKLPRPARTAPNELPRSSTTPSKEGEFGTIPLEREEISTVESTESGTLPLQAENIPTIEREFGTIPLQYEGVPTIGGGVVAPRIGGGVVLPETITAYKFAEKLIDLGDFIGVSWELFYTHKWELTLFVKEFTFLTKAIRPLPEKWHGIGDDDERYRKRYLDMTMDDELRAMFYRKAKFWSVTRDFMKAKGFLEVETPTIELTTGGAEARPFATHHHDYDVDVFMRICVGELWQKRLMAWGFPKTFEIGRAYRNEGSSPEHLQEFTNMEYYWAYADYEDGMTLVQDLYQKIALEVYGKTLFTTKWHTFDLAGQWPKIDYLEAVENKTGINLLTSTDDEMKSKLRELGVKYEGENRERLTDTLWKYVRKQITGPAFLVNHPEIISPLAKRSAKYPGRVERFQPIIAGSEVWNGFSELNDPLDQRARFEAQQVLLAKWDDEAMMPEWDFVEMLEHGMPPTCGFGFWERFFAFLEDKPLRECQYFPFMKPMIKEHYE